MARGRCRLGAGRSSRAHRDKLPPSPWLSPPDAVVGASRLRQLSLIANEGPWPGRFVADRQVFEAGRRLFSTWRGHRRHQSVGRSWRRLSSPAHPVMASCKGLDAAVGGGRICRLIEAACFLKPPPGRRASGGGHRDQPATGAPAPAPAAPLPFDDVDRRQRWQRAGGFALRARRLGFTWARGRRARRAPAFGGRIRLRSAAAASWRQEKPPRFGVGKPTTSASGGKGVGARRGVGAASMLSCQGRQERLGERLARRMHQHRRSAAGPLLAAR